MYDPTFKALFLVMSVSQVRLNQWQKPRQNSYLACANLPQGHYYFPNINFLPLSASNDKTHIPHNKYSYWEVTQQLLVDMPIN